LVKKRLEPLFFVLQGYFHLKFGGKMKKISLIVLVLLIVAFFAADWQGALKSLNVDPLPQPYWLIKGDDGERKFISQNWECHVVLWREDGVTPVLVGCTSIRYGQQEMFYDHSTGIMEEFSVLRDFKTFEYFER